MNDRIAMGAYEAVREFSLRIPDDVSVVSFDGSELAGWLRPTLTSVEIPYAELGATATAVLMSDSRGLRRLPMLLSPGGSVGAPIADGGRLSQYQP
jgi:LacI family transcriptional regulator